MKIVSRRWWLMTVPAKNAEGEAMRFLTRRRSGPPLSRLWHAVPCFPSISEGWLRPLEAYRG